MTSKNKLVAIIMVIVGIAIFAWESRTLNPHQVVRQLTHLNVWWLLVAVTMMLGSWVMETFVLRVLLRHEGEQSMPFGHALRVPLVEQLFNAITPFAAGGQPAQLVAMLQSGVEGGRASSVLLMKFIVYQFMVLINFVFTIFVAFRTVAMHFGALAFLIAFGMIIHVSVIVGLLLVMYYYRFTRKLLHWAMKPVGWFIGHERRDVKELELVAKIDTFYAESLHLKRAKKKVFRAAILTMIQLLMYYSVPYFVLLSLHVTDVDIIEVMALHVMIVIITSIFPIPGGSGGAEYSFKTIFSMYIGNPATMVLAMLLWRFLTNYLGMICGIGAIAVRPRQKPMSTEKLLK
ncbi:lysylphosphatidylglycerol synthase transmembrane domain-containing protein [Lacticaseibacillus pantheris]|uniref:Phosphatidylglycerol lysyltransferase n=1 Tax=Lacticaseibacillus pantheris DSM 15945 = JCM 12539 = NBRC 106106 TaxID=1423783 RepID=A0A0R1TZC8_9LACO|nr:lysylphosphatidylglycerol synthase transmembrane domain-containing protein [Lacticaseibacillus pantheris]KRL86592.1 membrane protein [Lacticaseibacillus pantheris DSM 15945 = JCM 12539 = NBRC 106106]